MSMSSHVVGFVPPDETWERMKDVWDACAAADISPPDEVYNFFGGETPDERGVEVPLEKTQCCREYNAEMCDGYEIDLTSLPAAVKFIRFYNSY